MSDQDLDKYKGSSITEQEKRELIKLKKQELALREREIKVTENRNKIMRSVVFALIGILVIIVAGVLFLQKSATNSQNPLSEEKNREIEAVKNTNAALVIQLTAEKLNDISNNSSLQATEILAATASPIPVALENPTQIPLPTNTPNTDTSLDTMLEVGQVWRQNGLELRLTKTEMGTASDSSLKAVQWGLFMTFELSNYSGNDIPLRYNLSEAVTATDNFGRSLKIGSPNQSWPEYTPETVSTVLSSGRTIKLESLPGYGDLHSVFFLVDVTNVSITEVIVSVDISRINNARWKIPIYH